MKAKLFILATIILVCFVSCLDWIPVEDGNKDPNPGLTDEQYFNLYCITTDPDGEPEMWERTSGSIGFTEPSYKKVFSTDTNAVGEFYILKNTQSQNPTYSVEYDDGTFSFSQILTPSLTTPLSGTIEGPDTTPLSYVIDKTAGTMTISYEEESVVFTLSE